MLIYLILFPLGLLLIFSIFLVFLKAKINKLERKIKYSFKDRTSSIPSLFEVSKPYLNKHNDVFKEILRLRKIEFAENHFDVHLATLLEVEGLIHHELNFIFKICNKHPNILKDGKFVYLRDIIIDKSHNIGKNFDTYKLVVKKYNNLLIIKNLTVIGFFIPVGGKIEI